MDKYELERMGTALAISLGIAVIGVFGMAFTKIYCFMPLAAVGICLSFPLGIWVGMGLLFYEGEDRYKDRYR